MFVDAANIEEPGTIVSASTLHNTFGFDGEYESKLDFNKTADQKVAELIALQLLLIDEVSMLDIDIRASSFLPLRNILFNINDF
jgi:DNA helicase TIP49 (TBP-interacting protein)